MTRAFLVLVFWVLVAAGLAQQGHAEEGCFYPINECPLYGGTKDRDNLDQVDQAFIRTAVASAGSREAAALQFIDYGWQSFREKDIPLAMERFNQAWLLDPKNGSVFHGMAVLVHVRDNNIAQADLLYQAALTAERISDPYLYADMGQFLGRTDRHIEAIAFLRKVLELDPATPGVRANLSISLLSTGSQDEACDVVLEAQERGETIKETLYDLACGDG